MIVIKEPYTSLILDGTKTLELRPKPIRNDYFLADSTSHRVKAFIIFGDSQELSQQEYDKTVSSHRCNLTQKPYKRTWATEILEVTPITEVAYRPKTGAIGYARYYRR